MSGSAADSRATCCSCSAFLSITIGALFIVLRGNFKRLFAYSSVEQMGIIAVALGFGGPLGFYGALLQTLCHAIAKAVLFLTSGDLVLRFRTRLVDEVRGVIGLMPLTGAALLLGALAVAGSPPFGLFLSELTIVRAGFASSNAVARRPFAGAARRCVHRADALLCRDGAGRKHRRGWERGNGRIRRTLRPAAGRSAAGRRARPRCWSSASGSPAFSTG